MRAILKDKDNEVLLIHMGGLGDVCLSESLFLSLSRYFKDSLVACGVRRFINLFPDYFVRIENIESAKWLFLFSQKPSDIMWERIIFTGKDKNGSLRSRLNRFSKNPIIFIDMYPNEEYEGECIHVEDYQLKQLCKYDIKPVKKEIVQLGSNRVILYPEKGFRKEKWDYENFLELNRILLNKGINTLFLESFDTGKSMECSMVINDLKDVKDLFLQGGIFVSNDSGMAHLAGACGLTTITIFTDFNPSVWHPRGRNISLINKKKDLSINSVLDVLYKALK